jgi:hypothetical protein
MVDLFSVDRPFRFARLSDRGGVWRPQALLMRWAVRLFGAPAWNAHDAEFRGPPTEKRAESEQLKSKTPATAGVRWPYVA